MTTTITGYVLDREEEPIRGATVRIVGDARRDRAAHHDRQQGAFRLTVAPDTEYILLASSRDYLNQFVRLRTDPQQALSEEYTVEFFLSSPRAPPRPCVRCTTPSTMPTCSQRAHQLWRPSTRCSPTIPR